jgi:hypothetical protein
VPVACFVLASGLFRPVTGFVVLAPFHSSFTEWSLLNFKPETGQKPLLARPVISSMEYKGIEYQIVQTAHPTGWRWIVYLDDRQTKMGVSSSRQYAIYDATNAIEKALSASDKAK